MDKMLTVTRDNTRHKREGIITLFQDRTLNYRTNSSSFAGHAGSCLTHTHTCAFLLDETHTHTRILTLTYAHTLRHLHTQTNTTHTQASLEQKSLSCLWQN